MAVVSRRIFGPALVPAVTGVIYTVPAGRTAIIRGLYLRSNSTTVAQNVNLYIGAASGGTCIWSQSVPVHPYATALPAEIILNPGDVLRGDSVLGSVVVAGFGSLLLGAPA